MKSKYIIECGTKEEKACIEDSLNAYKDYLNELISKNTSARTEKYYRDRLEILEKMIKEM